MTRTEIRLQGLGGQGVITAGHIIGEAASLHDRKEAIMTEDYSPYITGGWSRADLIISDEKIDYPLVSRPNILIAMSQDAFNNNWKDMVPGATIITEGGLVKTNGVKGRKIYAVPAQSIAEELGKKIVANIVMLGFLTAACKVTSREAMERALITRYPKAVELNRRAFNRGFDLYTQKEAK
jgi:2-oxoglutarate ferredoxin oxidoreductase subunit gamma